MNKELKNLLEPAELDYLVCALIRYQSELRTRTNIMEAYAAPGHLANHRAKLSVGEKLLEEFDERTP
jgi:hypothetical protein